MITGSPPYHARTRFSSVGDRRGRGAIRNPGAVGVYNPLPPGFLDEGTSGEKSDSLSSRVATIQETVTKIEQHLSKLDDIAEQLVLVRNEDLVKIQRAASGLVEVREQVTNKPVVSDATRASRTASETSAIFVTATLNTALPSCRT